MISALISVWGVLNATGILIGTFSGLRWWERGREGGHWGVFSRRAEFVANDRDRDRERQRKRSGDVYYEVLQLPPSFCMEIQK